MKLAIIPALLLSLAGFTRALEIPQIPVPEGLQSGAYAEGTVTRLSAEEVAGFLPWAQNARNQLNSALSQSRTLPLRDRTAHIERAVRAVVERSGARQYQMFLRFALNRGMLLLDELERNVNMNEIGSQEGALDLLTKAINVGLEFYETDLAFQQRAQTGDATIELPYARFGVAFMTAMYPGVVNVLDASAQYRLLYKLIEMTTWDLSRDPGAARYADVIVEAYELTQDLGGRPAQNDQATLHMVRQLHSLQIIQASQMIQRNATEPGGDSRSASRISCTAALINSGVHSSQAPNICTTNSSDDMVACTQRLISAGVHSTSAPNYCLATSSTEFITCTEQLMRAGVHSTRAPEHCKRNSSHDFVTCTTRLTRAGVHTTTAPEHCQAEQSEEYVTCVEGFIRAGVHAGLAPNSCH